MTRARSILSRLERLHTDAEGLATDVRDARDTNPDERARLRAVGRRLDVACMNLRLAVENDQRREREGR